MAARADEIDYLKGLARAYAGALVFGFPLLMTMEMWQLGVHMDRLRLALFVVVIALVVLGLTRFAGFRTTTCFADDVLDSLAALLVGFSLSAALLALLGLIGPHTHPREVIGMVTVEAAPASIGAALANKQLSASARSQMREDRASYGGELFLMAAGALFFAFSVAPTEEMILIGFKMTPWHGLATVVVSLMVLHALVFTVGFAGQEAHENAARAFLHFTLCGYAIALMVSLYTLWTFGQLDSGWSEAVRSVVVLGFPAALGAALARLAV